MIRAINKSLPFLAIAAILLIWFFDILFLPIAIAYTAIVTLVFQVAFGLLEYATLKSKNKKLTDKDKLFFVFALVFYAGLYVWGGMMAKGLYTSLIDMG